MMSRFIFPGWPGGVSLAQDWYEMVFSTPRNEIYCGADRWSALTAFENSICRTAARTTKTDKKQGAWGL